MCCLSNTQHTTFIYSWGEDSMIFSISENVHFWWNMINGYLKIDATCTLLLLLSFRKTPSSTQKHHFHTLHSHRKHRLDRTTMTSSTRATHPMLQMHRLDFKVKLCLLILCKYHISKFFSKCIFKEMLRPIKWYTKYASFFDDPHQHGGSYISLNIKPSYHILYYWLTL